MSSYDASSYGAGTSSSASSSSDDEFSFRQVSPFVFANGSAYPALTVNAGSDEEIHVPVVDLAVSVECNIATAFVRIVGQYKAKKSIDDAFFVLPAHEAMTVTALTIEVGNRMLETVVIGADEAQDIQRAKGGQQVGSISTEAVEIPVGDLKKGDLVRVDLTYIEQMGFFNGQYRLEIPMRTAGVAKSKVLSAFTVDLYTGSVPAAVADTLPRNYNTDAQSDRTIRHTFSVSDHDEDENLLFAYNVWNPSVEATLLYQAKAKDKDDRKPFVLFVSPPEAAALTHSQRRSIHFLLDVSGSMGVRVMGAAKKALAFAIAKLPSQDSFNVTLFNHDAMVLWMEPMRANNANKTEALEFVEDIQASGGTNILAPVKNALSTFPHDGTHLEFIYLITDGAVANERDICQHVKLNETGVRFMTFGIGAYCNTYFLKMLAQIGYGMSDFALNEENLEARMKRLLLLSQDPVWTNIDIVAPGATNVEMYPFPVTDIYVGLPLVVAGMYSGNFPSKVLVRATDAGGNAVKKKIPTMAREGTNLDRVFVKARLDTLIARYWLSPDQEKRKDEIVDLSVAEGIVTPYTARVAVELAPEVASQRRRELEDHHDRTDKVSSHPMPIHTSGNSNKKLAALAVGGVAGIVVLGIAAASFGSVADTASNVFTELGTMDFNLGGDFDFDIVPNDVGDCSCCGGDDGCCNCESSPCDPGEWNCGGGCNGNGCGDCCKCDDCGGCDGCDCDC